MAKHPHPSFSTFPMSKLRHIMVGDVMGVGSSKEGGGLGFSMEDAAVGMGNTLATCTKHYHVNRRQEGAQRVADGLEGYREEKRQKVGEQQQQQQQQQELGRREQLERQMEELKQQLEELKGKEQG